VKPRVQTFAGVKESLTPRFTNTETSRPGTLPPIATADKSPRGLGRDGNKPLMRNRWANEVPSPKGNPGGNPFPPAAAGWANRKTRAHCRGASTLMIP
jgi:hypothetical protein